MSKEKKPFWETGFGQFVQKASKVVPTIAGAVIGLPPKAAIATVAQLLTDSPELEGLALYDELQEKKLAFEKELLDADIRLAELEQADKENARNLQAVALASESWLAQHYLYLLATVVVFAAIGFGVGLMFIIVPEGNKRLVEMFADIFLFGGAVMVLQFFFGGAFRNKQKQHTE